MYFMSQDYEIMTEHLTKRFIDHGGIGLAPQRVAELPFHHGKGRFDVGTLVVTLQIFFPPVHEIVEHLLVHRRCLARCVPLESDKGCPVVGCNRGHVRRATISRICGNLRDRKCLRCSVYEGGKYWTVTGAFFPNLNSGNNVRFNPTHDLRFDPLRPLHHFAVLFGHTSGYIGMFRSQRNRPRNRFPRWRGADCFA